MKWAVILYTQRRRLWSDTIFTFSTPLQILQYSHKNYLGLKNGFLQKMLGLPHLSLLIRNQFLLYVPQHWVAQTAGSSTLHFRKLACRKREISLFQQ